MILASSSPRRREILEMFGLEFEIISPDIDEESIRNKYNLLDEVERTECLKELALTKARAVHVYDTIIAADTMVFSDKPMGKPHCDDDAKEMLLSLAGKTHEVITGVAIIKKYEIINFSDVSKVKFIDISDDYKKFVDYYVASGFSKGKAGSYGIQDAGAYFVEEIIGDFYNVMGLPISAVRHLVGI